MPAVAPREAGRLTSTCRALPDFRNTRGSAKQNQERIEQSRLQRRLSVLLGARRFGFAWHETISVLVGRRRFSKLPGALRFSCLLGVGALGSCVALACTPRSLATRADELDARSGTKAYRWLVDYEPSRLDVSGVSPASVAPFDPQARVRDAGANARTACGQAKRDAALLLIFAPESDAAARAAALDCGYALERDPAAVIVAPR
jgi:hypothetical protein